MTPQETVERALALSKADGCVVVATERSEANLRWAGNTLTTNGSMRSRQLAVISVVDGASGAAAGVVERQRGDRRRRSRTWSGPASRPPGTPGRPRTRPRWSSRTATGGPVGRRRRRRPRSGSSRGFAPALGEAFGRADGRAAAALRLRRARRWRRATSASSTGLRRRHAQPTGRIDINGKSAGLQPVGLGRPVDPRLRRRRRAAARSRADAAARLGASARSTCRPGATRRSCRRRRSPT